MKQAFKPHPLWRRVDGGKGKLSALYEGPRGWKARHCGHPTANYPWALYNFHGVMILTGALGHPETASKPAAFRAACGRAFHDLMQVFAFVDSPGSREFEQLRGGPRE